MSPVERLPSARSVAATFGLIVLVAALVPFVIFAVPQVVGADHGFVILSGSMEPTVSPGDVVIVDASAAVAVGDIITFDDGNDIPTTHRVIGFEGGQYVTQGDANQNPDAQRVAPGDVLGQVSLTIPYIGYVILWVNTPTGYVSLVVAPLVLLAANELFAWARTRNDTDESDVESDRTPKPAIRHIDEVRAERDGFTDDTDTTANSAPSSNRETVAVAAADLKLTTLATGGLVGYAAWNVYREVTVVATPSPVSVGALTGGLLGLGFAVWVTVSARRATIDSGRPSPAPSRTDGGTEAKR